MKRVGTCIYVHKSNIEELMQKLDDASLKLLLIVLDFHNENLDFEYDIVKVNIKNGNVSLIASPTWDILNEPIVGDSLCFNNKGSFKVVTGGTKVYHHKWQFVSNDYNGFDIKVSKYRSKEWESIPEIVQNKSKIGNKDYWYALLKKYNIKI